MREIIFSFAFRMTNAHNMLQAGASIPPKPMTHISYSTLFPQRLEIFPYFCKT